MKMEGAPCNVGSSHRHYVEYLDGLRACAAIFVALTHVRSYTIGLHAAKSGWALFLSRWLSCGELGVAIFIVISGYCLTLPVLRTGSWSFRRGERSFIIARARRLIPPYYAALILSVPLFLIEEHVSGFEPHRNSILSHVVLHVLLIHNLVSAGIAHYFNAALWSVGAEWQIYLVFAILLLPATRRLGVIPTTAVALVVSTVPHFAARGWLDWTAPWLIGLFGFGMVAAAIAHSPAKRFRRMATSMPWSMMCGLALLLFLVVMSQHTEANFESRKLYEDVSAGLVVALFLIAAAGADARIRSSPIAAMVRLLRVRILLVVGSFSYSLYLVHMPIIRLAAALMTRQGVSEEWQFIFIVFLLLPIVAGIAYLFFLVAERPFISAGRQRAIAEEAGSAVPERVGAAYLI